MRASLAAATLAACLLATLPAQVIPAQVIPAQVIPAQVIPAQVIPAQVIPAQAAPAQAAPAQAAPAQAAPAQAAPAQAAPAQADAAQASPTRIARGPSQAAPPLQPSPDAVFSAEELQRVLSHGPWPPPTARDPSNRFSGSPEAIELGRRLFLDTGLSGDGRLACAGCHDPARGFTDGLPRARGLAAHDRNTQGLLDVADQRWFGWDGGADSLWAAAIRPLRSPAEMGSSAALVARRLRQDPGLAAAYRAARQAGPASGPGGGGSRGAGAGGPRSDDEAVLVDAGKALAAWMETLRSPRTRFDDFRDALARGDERAASAYPAAARRGLRLFVGRGNCWMCHVGPGFTNGEFHDVGIPFLAAPGRVDPGRHAGLQRLQSDPYRLTGRWADGDGSTAIKTLSVRREHRNWGEWRTPTLRGLSASAPYMHDGRLRTLRDVLRHYSELDEDRLHADGEAILRPLRLRDAEIDDLLAFLRTLDPAPGP